MESSPASADVSLNLFLRLQEWLQELDIGLVGVIRTGDSDGRTTEFAINIRQL